MRGPSFVALVAVIAATLHAAPGAAGDKAPPPAASAKASAAPAASGPPAPETADSLYNQGNEAYDRGDYALALELYTGAFKLRKSYDIARNLGLTTLKLGRYKDAIGHFEYSLSHYPSNRADTKKQVVDWLAQAKAQVGALRLTVEPEGAVCKVNGVEIGRDERAADVPVDPGEVRVECGGVDGYRSEKRTVTIAKGGREEVDLTLDATGVPGPGVPGEGDRNPFGAFGTGDRRLVITWAGVATAVVGLGVGGALGVMSLVNAGEADGLRDELRAKTGRESPCSAPADSRCGELLALRKEQDVFGNVGFWMMIAGGLVGAGTVTYVVLTEPAAPAPKPALPRAAVVPVVAPGGAAVVLSGSF